MSIAATAGSSFYGARMPVHSADLRFVPRYGMKPTMEKIDPQQDHERLERFRPGQQVIFRNKGYTIQRRTTLASGEAAVVLQSDKEQFVIGAQQFLAGVK
jgi:hypothetical protein